MYLNGHEALETYLPIRGSWDASKVVVVRLRGWRLGVKGLGFRGLGFRL